MSKHVELIQKLIAHQKSAQKIGNLAEAEAFAAKVAELLFKHNLSMSDIEIREQEIAEPIAREYVCDAATGRHKKGRKPWMEALGAAVAKACFCRHLIVNGTTTQIFVGRTSDRQAAAAMYSHLIHAATTLLNQERKELRYCNPFEDSRARANYAWDWAKDFLLGFSQAVSKRLVEDRKQLAAQSAGYALVVRKDAALNQWWEQNSKGFKASRAQKLTLHAGGGYHAGVRAGSNVSLSNRTGLRG